LDLTCCSWLYYKIILFVIIKSKLYFKSSDMHSNRNHRVRNKIIKLKKKKEKICLEQQTLSSVRCWKKLNSVKKMRKQKRVNQTKTSNLFLKQSFMLHHCLSYLIHVFNKISSKQKILQLHWQLSVSSIWATSRKPHIHFTLNYLRIQTKQTPSSDQALNSNPTSNDYNFTLPFSASGKRLRI
jgi:hypothetical protein